MMHSVRGALLACLMVLLTACGGGGSGEGGNQAGLRFVQASPDAPPLALLVDGTIVSQALDFGQNAVYAGRAFLLLTPRRYDLEVQGFVPPADTPTFLELPGVEVVSGREYTLLTTGLTAGDDLQPVLIDNPIEPVPTASIRMLFVHAAPAMAAMDVYVTTADAPLDQATPFATLGFREYSARTVLPAGTYQIRLTPAGDPGTVLLDTGAAPFLGNEDLLLVAVPNEVPGGSSLKLLLNGGGPESVAFDVNTRGQVRVLNLSPDSPPLRVIAIPADEGEDVDLTGDFPAGLPFTESTSFRMLQPDAWLLQAEDVSNPGTVLAEGAISVSPNQRFTFLVLGKVEALGGIFLPDNTRSVATEARLRFVNAAPSKFAVDVYVTPDGNIAEVTPALPSLGLGTVVNHLPAEPRDYVVTFTDVNTKTVLATAPLPAPAGSVRTVIVYEQAGGEFTTLTRDDLP